MKKSLIGLAALLLVGLAGCSNNADRDGLRTQSYETDRNVPMLLSQLPGPPSMDPHILQQSDAQIVQWMRSIDQWMFKTISIPISGQMDEMGARSMKMQLRRVFSADLSDRILRDNYKYDPATRTYQNKYNGSVPSLQTEWHKYDVVKQGPPNMTKITIRGISAGQREKASFAHTAVVKTQGNRLIITQYGNY